MPVLDHVIDGFGATNQTGLGANWTADPYGDGTAAPDIVSNAAKNPGTGLRAAWWNYDTSLGGTTACAVHFQLGNASNTVYELGIATSGVGTSSIKGYEFDLNPQSGNWNLYRQDSSTTSLVIASGTRVFAAGAWIGLIIGAPTDTGVRVFYSEDGLVTSPWPFLTAAVDNTYRSTSCRAYIGMLDGGIIENFGSFGHLPRGSTLVWGPRLLVRA